DADVWSLHARRREAQALQAAGMSSEARAIRAAIAQERPWDLQAVTERAWDLASFGDVEGAIAYVAERATQGGPWLRSESDLLFHAWANWLYGLRDLPGFEAVAKAWTASGTRDRNAYSMLVASIYFRERFEEADRWVVDHLNADVATLADPAARAA